MVRVAAPCCSRWPVSSPYCYILTGVRMVPEERKVQPDILLACFVVCFFSYLTWLLVRNLDREP